jgi:hypothetical protein
MLDRDLDVTHIQLPTHFKDFERDVLKECMDIQEVMDDHVAVGFSFGGLALSYMFKARRRIFISPFWSVNEKWMTSSHEHMIKLLRVITTPILKRQFEKEDAGPLAVDGDIFGIPERLSLRTIDEFVKAQGRLPDPRSTDHIFFSHQDKVVSATVIEKRVDQFSLGSNNYYGGHMFYLTRGRSELVDLILEQIENGFDQSHSAN